MPRTRLALLAVPALAGAALVPTALHRGTADAHAAARPTPGDFVPRVTNRWFPLRPGSRWVYVGVKDGVRQVDVVRVRHRTKRILGVRCTVVSDVARHGRRVLERTEDWYAQDRRGAVWYFGEATVAYQNGHADRSGSWQAGVHGARQGIIMAPRPRVGQAHRQEYWRGRAEDQYWLVATHQRVSVPVGAFRNVVQTFEWSRLEPDIIDRKLYVRGIGVVEERSMSGEHETAALVRFRR